jgi:putative heme-binding domain-containing protein
VSRGSGSARLIPSVRLILRGVAAALAGILVLAGQSGPGRITGDAAAGKAIFEGKGGCLNCHSIENHGGSLGPDLSEIGIMRTPESLRLAIIDPDAEIYQEYLTVVVTTGQGQKVEGIALNEDDISIQIRDTDGNPRSFLKDNLQEVRREERSLMPSYAGKLSPSEINDLVAYLRTLRGASAPAGAPVRRTRQIAPVSENIAFLTRPERDADERPESLLDALQIPSGATVADLGAGAGYFTWRLARRVGPRGKVIAVDIQQQMLDLTAAELKKRNITNVDLVLGTEQDPHLAPGALDLVLIANAYHEFSQPELVMAAVRRSLKPNGRLVVLEYQKENTYAPVPSLHKMSFEELRTEIESMGFQLDRVLDFLPLQHGLIFIKTP